MIEQQEKPPFFIDLGTRDEQAVASEAYAQGYKDGMLAAEREGREEGEKYGRILGLALLDIRTRLRALQENALIQANPRLAARTTGTMEAFKLFKLENIRDDEREVTLSQLQCRVRELEANLPRSHKKVIINRSTNDTTLTF